MRRAVLLLALLPAACHYPPAGQVVARVDGEEITRRDLDVELAATGLAGPDASRVTLDRLINRRLLVAEARRQGLDRTPDYLAAIRRDRDLRLIGALAGRQYPALSAEPLRRRLETESRRLAATARIERQPGF